MSYEVTFHKGVLCVKKGLLDRNRELPKIKRDDPPKRGKVRGLSRKSRKNLLRVINKLEPSQNYYFLTLTYSAVWVDDPKVWHRHLALLFKRLRANFPKSSGLWRLEFQKRKAPHFHILLHVPNGAKNLFKVCQQSWLNSIDDHSWSAREYAVDLSHVGSEFKNCALYQALYQAKDANDRIDIATGKCWGRYNKRFLPTSCYGCVEITLDEQKQLRRICRKWLQAWRKDHGYARYLKAPQGSFDIFLPLHAQKRLLAFVRDGKVNDFGSGPKGSRSIQSACDLSVGVGEGAVIQ